MLRAFGGIAVTVLKMVTVALVKFWIILSSSTGTLALLNYSLGAHRPAKRWIRVNRMSGAPGVHDTSPSTHLSSFFPISNTNPVPPMWATYLLIWWKTAIRKTTIPNSKDAFVLLGAFPDRTFNDARWTCSTDTLHFLLENDVSLPAIIKRMANAIKIMAVNT